METLELSLGQQLKAGRESQGLTAEGVAEKLRWNVQRVIDLENDLLGFQLPLTYARGYVSAYARLLGLSLADILGLFEKMDWVKERHAYEESLIKHAQTRNIIEVKKRKKIRWLHLAILLSLGLTALISWLAWSSHGSQETTEVSNAVPEFVVPPQNLPSSNAASGEMIITPVKPSGNVNQTSH